MPGTQTKQIASTTADKSASTDADYKALYETSEKRRKDAQSVLTPLHQENARLKAELATQGSAPQISSEEQDRLNDLKFSDPDVWRAEANKADLALTKAHEEAVDAEYGKIVTEMTQEQLVANAKKFFTDKSIDAATVINSMPKALQTMIDNGEIPLEEGLQRGIDLVNGATVKSVLAPSSPNLSNVAGSDKPTDGAKVKQQQQDWSSAVI